MEEEEEGEFPLLEKEKEEEEGLCYSLYRIEHSQKRRREY